MEFRNFFFLNKTALHVAVEKGNIEIVELLLSNPNININILSISKYFFFIKIGIVVFFLIFVHRTALHIAIDKENMEIIKLLLENTNIDINLKETISIFFILIA